MRQFGELEAAVMDQLWSWSRPTAVREVFDQLSGGRELAYTTIMTVMDRLHSKGLLRRELVSRAYLYEPLVTREQYTANMMAQALSGSEDRAAALLHFVAEMSSDERSALRIALRRAAASER